MTRGDLPQLWSTPVSAAWERGASKALLKLSLSSPTTDHMKPEEHLKDLLPAIFQRLEQTDVFWTNFP